MRGGLVLIAVALAGCGEQRDEAAQANDAAAAAEVDILPPDESVSTPTEDLADGVIEPPPPGNAIAPNPITAIPPAMHGRWGVTPADCNSERGKAQRGILVSADAIVFYESLAKPVNIVEYSPTRIRGEFAFTGEGMTWTNPMIWSLENEKLVRIDSEPDSRLVYRRCEGGQGVR